MSKRNIIARNRKNALSSTGPTSPEGKARSSQNGLVHGMYATTALLSTENREEYLRHQAGLAVDLKPIGAAQEELVLQISDNYWRIRRIRILETLQLDRFVMLLTQPPSGFDPKLNAEEPNYRNLEALGRYCTRIENSTLKALKQLMDLQLELRLADRAKEEAALIREEEAEADVAREERIARYDSPDPFGPRWIYEIKPEGDQKTPDQKDKEAPPTEK